MMPWRQKKVWNQYRHPSEPFTVVQYDDFSFEIVQDEDEGGTSIIDGIWLDSLMRSLEWSTTRG